MSDRIHLGDGAYVTDDGWYLWLTADRSCDCGRCGCGQTITHRVALKPSGLVALVEYAVRRTPELAELLQRAAGGDR